MDYIARGIFTLKVLFLNFLTPTFDSRLFRMELGKVALNNGQM